LRSLHGLGSAVFEIVVPFKGDAFRVVYAVAAPMKSGWSMRPEKESTQGIKRPQREIELIKDGFKRLKKILRRKPKS